MMKTTIPREVEHFFAEQRKEQQQYVAVGRINGTLRETTRIAIHALDQVAQRGLAMSECEERAIDLERSSSLFLIQVTPWWRRCWPQWWWCPYQQHSH